MRNHVRATLDTANDVAYLSDVEQEIVFELNKVRSDPGRYAETYLAPRRSYYNGKILERPGETRIMTNEGVAALDECIRVLKAARPVTPLAPSKGLSRAARDHVADTGPSGILGHTGSDGSTLVDRVERYGSFSRLVGENIAYGRMDAREIVIQLLVDDGVPSRGHRENILESKYGVVGVAVGPHSRYRSMCVMDFAGGFSEKM